MSGIFGLFRRDGAPVARDEIERMRAGMAHWGVDGGGVWLGADSAPTRSASVALGHVLLATTPEARLESLPHFDAKAGLAITSASRLDNRADLARELGVPPSEAAATPDCALILRAYRAFGEECVRHLVGDWSFAIWDAARQSLFVARDPCGNTNLCYFDLDGTFAFASSPKGLLALPFAPRRPNMLALAKLLVTWSSDDAETAYDGIECVRPAHSLTVTRDSCAARRYWSLDAIAPVRLGSDDEYVEAFREVFGQAVACRARADGDVGALASGGLDSSAVAVFAADQLRQRGRKLQAYTSVPMYDPRDLGPPDRQPDERAWVEAVAKYSGHIETHFLRSESVTPLQGVARQLAIHDAPSHAAGNAYWIVDAFDTMRRAGLRVVLTGQGGNQTISWQGLPLSGQSLSARARLRLALGGMKRRALGRANANSPTPTPDGDEPDVGSDAQPWMASRAAIRADFARELRLAERMTAAGFDRESQVTNTRQARLRRLDVSSYNAGPLWHRAGGELGCDVRDPTRDQRVVEFCVGIPDEQFSRDGRQRLLVRRALRGLAPDSVRLNTRRGFQAADIGWRVRHSADEIERALADLERSPMASACLDLPRMRAVLDGSRAELGPEISRRCNTLLLRGLSVGLFLLRFSANGL